MTILSDMNNKFNPRSANPELQIIKKRHNNSVKSKQLHRTLRENIIWDTGMQAGCTRNSLSWRRGTVEFSANKVKMRLFILFRIQNVTLLDNMKDRNNAVCVLVGTEINYSYVILLCCRTGLNSLCSDETTDDKKVVNTL